MDQNSSPAANNQQEFVERVIESQTVWALKSAEGYATSESNEYEDVEVIPFWSEEASASALAKDEWEGFEAASMPLAEFLEYWLVGMSNDGIIAGINWDQDLFGTEVEPLDLALEISNKLVEAEINLDLEKYKNIRDYNSQVKNALELE